VENCLINAPAGGVAITADDSRVWYSTVRGDIKAEGTTNLLVAENHIYGTPVSVKVTGAHNSVVLLNRMMGATVEESTSIFVADNAMGYDLAASSVNYLLGNNNTLGEKAAVRLSAVTNQSGNTLNDIDARLEVGANEELLPKQNKDAFVGMARKSTVRERDMTAQRLIHTYLGEETKARTTVILAPGAYSYSSEIRLLADTLPNVTIYAYGVLAERADYHHANVVIEDTDHLTIKGLATGHPMNSSGTSVAISKNEETLEIELIAGAGMIKDWTDTDYYAHASTNRSIFGYRAGHTEPYADMTFETIRYDAATNIMTIKVSKPTFDIIQVGDGIACRGDGISAYLINRSVTPSLEDVSVYGAAGFGFNDSRNTGKSLNLHRAWVTYAPAAVITEQEYQRYRGYEEQYGVHFGLSIDEHGNYRGTPNLISTLDATHSSYCKEGIKLTSCLFEGMNDDGTNQGSGHGRLIDVQDLGDGTVKLTYTTTLSKIAYNNTGARSGGTACEPFAVGDPLYMYTSKGQVICDNSPVLSVSKKEESFINEFGGSHLAWSIIATKADINLDALAGIELKLGTPFVDYVAVDNHAWSSDGYVIDNCIIRDTRSRCLLLQSSNGVVKNCSLTGCGMSAVLIWHDMDWGESGISANIKVQNNYIENTSHYADQIILTPIYVMGIGERIQDDYFTQVNIEISGNHIVDYNTTYAIALDSVRNSKILNNTFSARKGHSAEESVAINLFAVKDIEIAGNVFAVSEPAIEDVIHAERYKNLYGKDVEMDGTPLFPDDV
ncbi:MAG: right-handed parallel beta-helix repeat-containing protein, partial [Clostridia bacterium]|nr:right-handed parallel beta-helix repeat-containing protein [Clostridia bacterium]